MRIEKSLIISVRAVPVSRIYERLKIVHAAQNLHCALRRHLRRTGIPSAELCQNLQRHRFLHARFREHFRRRVLFCNIRRRTTDRFVCVMKRISADRHADDQRCRDCGADARRPYAQMNIFPVRARNDRFGQRRTAFLPFIEFRAQIVRQLADRPADIAILHSNPSSFR